MRELLSNLLVSQAQKDSGFIALSGDHGYALFDRLRNERPKQFMNVGVAEQMMVGLAAGLARTGFRPIVYGLSSFIPIRVLEQIKLDVCFSSLPVVFLGDGAGLVYSTLGASHQCGEDVACLRPLPSIQIYSPCDEEELRVCFEEAFESGRPSYIRIGKSDRKKVHANGVLNTTEPAYLVKTKESRPIVLTTGSFTSVSLEYATQLGMGCISIPRIKPFPRTLFEMVQFTSNTTFFIVEEHCRYGGLASALMDACVEYRIPLPKIISFSLNDMFSMKCGDYQYALSEHQLSDPQLAQRLKAELETQNHGTL